jgi:hypothetical protein
LKPRSINIFVLDGDPNGTVFATVGRDGKVQPTKVLKLIEREIAAVRPSLVVLDTLANLHALDPNSQEQAKAFVSLLIGIAQRHGCTFVLLAHPTRSAGLDAAPATTRRGSTVRQLGRINSEIAASAERVARGASWHRHNDPWLANGIENLKVGLVGAGARPTPRDMSRQERRAMTRRFDKWASSADQNGEEVEYKSDSEMARALAALDAEIAAFTRPMPSSFHFTTSKGT